MSNTDSSAWVETDLEATGQLSDRNNGGLRWSPEFAAWMRSNLERELTTEEIEGLLRLNFCSTLDELIQRFSVPKHL